MTSTARHALASWSLAMLLGLVIVWNSRFTADMSFFLPAHPSAEQQVLVDQLKEGAVTRLLMIALGGGEARQRAALSRDLQARLADRPELAAVRNGDSRGLDADRSFLFRHRYLLSPSVTPERFGIEGLRDAISASLDRLAGSAGLLIKPLLPQDPTSEFLGLLTGLDAGAQPNQREGVWASRDGERAILVAQTNALGSDTDGQAAAIQAIREAFAAAVEVVGPTDARLQIAGPGVFAVQARATIKGEVTRLTSLGGLAILGLLFFVYRSFRLLTLGLLPVVSGALAGIVAVSLAFDSVFGITLGFGSALIGEAVDYSIYYLVQSGRQGATAWRTGFWPTIRLGVLTSVCGFGVLLFSGFPGLAQLGLYALSGLLAAAVVTRFVLPHLVSPEVGPRDLSRLGDWIRRLGGHLQKLRWWLLLIALPAAASLFVNTERMWTRELSALSTADPEDVAIDTQLRADLGAPDARLLILVSGSDPEAALQAAERVGARLDSLVAAGLIGGYDTPARFLPSTATQAARRASLPSATELRERLSLALAGRPLSPGKLEPFLRDVETARTAPLISRDSLQNTSLALVVDALLLKRDQGWSALLPVRPPAGQVIDAQALSTALLGSDALFIDMKTEFDGLYTQYLEQAWRLSLLGFLAILALLVLKLRSGSRLWRVMAPLLLAVLFVITGLRLAGVSLQLLHLIGLLLIVAVGSNYALFFDRLGEGAPDESQTLASLLVACLTTAIGFGTLALAKVPVLQALGVTVGPGAILALLLAAAFSTRLQRP